jgi:sugar lactone lactonase YvrE
MLRLLLSIVCIFCMKASASTTASVVYGQGGSFTTRTSNVGGVNAGTLVIPTGVACDASNNLYIVDAGNTRILNYLAGSTVATRVYGQSGSFTTNVPGVVSANTANAASGVAVDGIGNVYITDQHRVLFYSAGSTTASRVYGQSGSFSSSIANNGGVSANSLNAPHDVTLDSLGNLYVSDSDNHRVLYFLAGSTTATRVYGQAGSFTNNVPNNGGVSASSLNYPYGLTVDTAGNLYVAEGGNQRVLCFGSGSTTAFRVFGQGGSFTSNAGNNGGINANSLLSPSGVTVDATGNVYIVDLNNHRVLYYNVGSTTATRVYGQGGSFTTNLSPVPPSASSFNNPSSSCLDGAGNLYVSDTNNNRVLRFASFATSLSCAVSLAVILFLL